MRDEDELEHPDVIRISANTSGGRDFIIGDVHGGAAHFAAVLAKLKENDRLFLVGDLLDRGEDSLKIIELIQKANEGKDPPVVYAVRGNHEELFLDAAAFLRSPNPNYSLAACDSEKGHPLLNFLNNGGEWIYADAQVREQVKQFFQKERRYAKNPGQFPRPDAQEFLNSLKNKELVKELDNIVNFVKKLPYIILVGETTDPGSFVVDHADMPLKDESLDKVINEQQGKLTPEQKHYVMWARPPGSNDPGAPIIGSITDEQRTETSVISYVGHNAISVNRTQSEIEAMIEIAIREKTNTINLDFDGFRYGFVVVNHTNKTAFFVKADSETITASEQQQKKMDAFQNAVIAAISRHLEQNYAQREGDIQRQFRKIKKEYDNRPKEGTTENTSQQTFVFNTRTAAQQSPPPPPPAIQKFEATKKEIEEKMTRCPTPGAYAKFADEYAQFADEYKKFNNANGSTKQSPDSKNTLKQHFDTCIKLAEDYRKLFGVAQIEKYDQKLFVNSDVNQIVNYSKLVTRDYKIQKLTVDNKEIDVRYYHDKNKNSLVILHPATDVIALWGAKDDEKDSAAKKEMLAHIESVTTALKQQLSLTNITTTHILPEAGSGRLRSLDVGPESVLAGSRHIRLRIVEQQQDKNFADSYNDASKSKLFDPRDVGLSAQNTLDDTNCGRYIAAMTIQAAGLLADGFEVTKENLKASPAVARALHFNSVEDAQKGLEHAYVKPLSKNSSPEATIEHYEQKIACLKAEYLSRQTNVHREFHGTSIIGGYGTSTFLTKLFGYSATEKAKAVTAIEKAIQKAGGNITSIDFSTLPKAARQGELGKCVAAIEKEIEKINKIQSATRTLYNS